MVRSVFRSVSALVLLFAATLVATPARTQPYTSYKPAIYEEPVRPEWGLLVFGGEMSNGDFGQVVSGTGVSDREDIYFGGVALSRRVHDGSYIDLELEGGAGYQFAEASENDTGQVWGALYVRYDRLPWNHIVHTTLAISTGLNYHFEETAHEESEAAGNKTRKLLHYLSPEITFAHPGHLDLELVLRLHHRSGVFGLFGCDKCGSNMVTAGLRKRF